MQRPAFVRKTKHVRVGHEDIGYSYVVICRGKRPSPFLPGDTENTHSDIAQSETGDDIRLEAYNWPRLVFPPLKRSGHVILDGCTAEGNVSPPC